MKTIIEVYNYYQQCWEKYAIADDYWHEYKILWELEEQGYSREKDIRSRVYREAYTCSAQQ